MTCTAPAGQSSGCWGIVAKAPRLSGETRGDARIQEQKIVQRLAAKFRVDEQDLRRRLAALRQPEAATPISGSRIRPSDSHDRNKKSKRNTARSARTPGKLAVFAIDRCPSPGSFHGNSRSYFGDGIDNAESQKCRRGVTKRAAG